MYIGIIFSMYLYICYLKTKTNVQKKQITIHAFIKKILKSSFISFVDKCKIFCYTEFHKGGTELHRAKIKTICCYLQQPDRDFILMIPVGNPFLKKQICVIRGAEGIC
jgi:hypothetical protein